MHRLYIIFTFEMLLKNYFNLTYKPDFKKVILWLYFEVSYTGRLLCLGYIWDSWTII